MSDEAPGVIVTLPEIYKKVLETDTKLDKVIGAVEQMVAINSRLDNHGERLRKIESQLAAQWIVVGVVVTVIGAAVVKTITG
ncbi:hypothetical protein ACIFOC_00434 [Leucobacter aridicollis]|uniref:Putative Fe-S cluster-containing protein n=1 Tax=Leucobacter aridicollis TaxID=283878 RepID=A0A852RHB5_9MICO|nr:hypothetical protein [Leucobacter aridicollis]NYD26072.1 putative Fe-S cluster-containing protein [Leucobacter aridicollis]